MKYLAARLGNTKIVAPMRSIYLERQTGILEIEGPQLKKRLCFVDGELYLRRSDLPLTKKISAVLDHQASDPARPAGGTGRRNGAAAGTTNSRAELRVLANMIGEHWTAWNATSCRFIQGLDTAVGDLVGPLPTARLLIAAARAARTEDEIVEQLGGIDASIIAVPDHLTPAGSIITRSDEAILLELCREPITLGEIIGRSNGDGTSTLTTLSRLWVTGLLSPYTPGESFGETRRDETPEGPSPEVEVPQPTPAGTQTRRIWTEHFRLSGDPFSLTPDPAFLFLSEGHTEALAALEVGLLERRGLTVLIGEVGTGKTTLLYSLLSDIGSEVETAFIANTTLSFDEILQSALADLGVDFASTRRVDLLESLNSFLLNCSDEAKTVALVVDEAHALSADAFEGLRQLLNFETYDQKLLQIFLVGQPELGARLRQRDLRQVADRIAVRCDLHPLKRNEAREYIEHRLEAAGAVTPVFSRRAIDLIIRESGRIPRSINVLCHNAMLFAYARNLTTVTRSAALEAVRERKGPKSSIFSFARNLGARSLSGFLLILALAWSWLSLAGGGAENAALEPAEVPGSSLESMVRPVAEPDQPPPAPPVEPVADQPPPTRVTTTNLNLRTGPSLDDSILSTLPEGTQVVLLSEEDDWAIVRSGNQSGWVKTSFLGQSRQSESGGSAP